jgi:aminoglycoside phosphotransferase
LETRVEVNALDFRGITEQANAAVAAGPMESTRGSVQAAGARAKVHEAPATLAQFLDPEWAAQFFETLPQIASPGSGPLRCEVVPLKLRERRGTGVMLFKLRWAGPSRHPAEGLQLVGKITSGRRRAPTGEKAFWILNELWENGFGSGPLRVPCPVAYIRASNFMLTSAVPGADLITLFREGSESVPEAVRLAARWLSKLHLSRISSPPARTLEKQFSKVERVVGDVEHAHPTLAPRTREVGQNMLRAMGSVTEASFTPVHGDFLLKNVMTDGSTLTGIDFEEGGMFDPAKDVGKFLGSLAVKGAIHEVPFDVPRLQRSFLKTYRKGSGLEMGERIAAYHAVSLIKHARRQTTANDAAVWVDAALALFEEARA